jgi:hypothetical protein
LHLRFRMQTSWRNNLFTQSKRQGHAGTPIRGCKTIHQWQVLDKYHSEPIVNFTIPCNYS